MRSLPADSKASKKEFDEVVSLAIDKFPEVIDYYIRQKEEEGAKACLIARERVAIVKTLFIEQLSYLVAQLEPTGFYEKSPNTYEEAKARVLFLKDVIENKGGHRVFYINGQPIEREADLQVLYRLTWFATPSTVSREVNDGRGPVDFQVSRGKADKTLVEFKLAANSKLEKNLANQCDIYEKASEPTHPTLKVILYFSPVQLGRVNRILKRLDLQDSPHIVLIDACDDNKPSGSKA